MARRARKAYVASPLPLTMTATVRGGGVYPPGHGECGTRTATLTARCLTGGVLRLYRYRAGGLFGKHVDESVETKDGEVTGCTVLVYLNDEGLEGGETVFYRGDGNKVAARFTPKRGSVLFHGHGDDCMTHEALPVRKGEKLVLRTDILYTSRDTPYPCIDVSATML